MYYVFERNDFRRYAFFETKSDFNKGYQSAWGRILGEDYSLRDAILVCGGSREDVDALNGPKNYLVVYEFTATTGGKYKNRIVLGYHSEFEARHLAESKDMMVIAKGTSEEEARVLVATVPPICIYLGAIEDAFKTDSSNVCNYLEMSLALAHSMVDTNQRILWAKGQTPPYPDKNFTEHLRKLKWEESAKAMVITSLALLYSFADNEINRTVTTDKALINALVDSYKMALDIYPAK